MGKAESEAAYERMGTLMQAPSWSQRYVLDERRVRTYQDDDKSYRVIELRHDGLKIELTMHCVPPDNANLEFANTIMDAAEHVIKNGVKIPD